MSWEDVMTQDRVWATRAGLGATVKRLAQHRLTLVVVAGPDRGKRCDVHGQRVSLGTAATSDLRLSDDTVSRHHCEIFVRSDRYVVRDHESTNGTLVDGVRVFEAVLEPGQRLTLGESELLFESSRTWVPLGTSEAEQFGELSGKSDAMRTVFSLLEKVAPTTLTCLIMGETGTGKELAARSLHKASPRAAAPFVVLDCGAVHDTLIEAELFGHEKGAYTGADRSRAGAFERGHGGTILLDEIGELPLDLQPKLLRVLERREVTRIGAHAAKDVDVRIIAATHRDLAAMVQMGSFREDLYYRLAEVIVEIPPLREHREDIPLLATRMLTESDSQVRVIAQDAFDYLNEQAWPGNVRELRNTIRRGAALATGPTLTRDLLESLELTRRRPPAPRADESTPASQVEVSEHLPLKEARQHWVSTLEREYLARLQKRFGHDVDAAAHHAGLHRKSLLRLWRQHGLSDSE